jgi:hypothetical protein
MTKPFDPHGFTDNVGAYSDHPAATIRDAEQWMANHGPDPDAAQHWSDLEAAVRSDFRSRRQTK